MTIVPSAVRFFSTVPLGKLCSFQSGGTPSKSCPHYWDGTIPWVTSAEINGGNISPPRFHITDQGLEHSAAVVVPSQTLLLVTRTGVGKVAFTNTSTSFNQDVCAVIPAEDRLHKRYLFRFLETQLDYFKRYSRGATIKGITRPYLNGLRIPIPYPDDPARSLQEQRRIAAILDKADTIRRKREDVCRVHDDFGPSLFNEMFGFVLTNPKQWAVERFNQVCDSRLGKMLDAKQQTGLHCRPYLRNTNVQWNSFVLDDLLEMDFDEKDRREFSLQYGDVLVCEGGEIGRAAIWKEEIKVCYFQKALHRVRPREGKATSEFILYLLWELAKHDGFSQLTAQATIAHLPGVKLKALPVPLPPYELQLEFSRLLKASQRYQATASIGDTTVNTLFDSLVQRAFRGEL